jgi:hypothetical protein
MLSPLSHVNPNARHYNEATVSWDIRHYLYLLLFPTSSRNSPWTTNANNVIFGGIQCIFRQRSQLVN